MIAKDHEITEFFTAIEEIDHKNRGGCLLFCYAFFLWLKSRGHDLHDFTIYHVAGNWGYLINTNIDFLDGRQTEPTSGWHFVWKYNGEIFDSCGRYFLSYDDVNLFPENKAFSHFGTRETAIANFCIAALNKHEWNTRFHRPQGMDIAESNLMIEFAGVDRWDSLWDEE